jgi:cell division septation protein DedD
VSNSAEDGFHEIQLTGKQLVFLFMATTVVAVVIFLCGVLVGRGVRTERAAADGAASGTTTAAAAGEAGAPPPAAAPQAGEPSPATSEDLSYAKRLQGEDPKEQLKPDTGATDTTAEPPTPEESPAEQAPPPPPATSTQPPPPASSAATRERAGENWFVQVAALRDRAAALAIIRRLSAKGYDAFIVEPRPGAPAPGFRVRVGPFQDRRQADQASRRLEREEQFKPFITR